jgi:putative endonuclease
MRMIYFVYVLRNPDGKIYIGQTADITIRLQQHNDPGNKFTRTTKRFRGPWKIVYSEELPSRAAALARERALKSGRGRAWLKFQLSC